MLHFLADVDKRAALGGGFGFHLGGGLPVPDPASGFVLRIGMRSVSLTLHRDPPLCYVEDIVFGRDYSKYYDSG
jgi:hypothetical protein